PASDWPNRHSRNAPAKASESAWSLILIAHLPIATSVNIAAKPTATIPIHSQNIVFMPPSVGRGPGVGQPLASSTAGAIAGHRKTALRHTAGGVPSPAASVDLKHRDAAKSRGSELEQGWEMRAQSENQSNDENRNLGR